jgi:hypothetical protein
LEAELINAEQVVRTVFRLLARRFRDIEASQSAFLELQNKEYVRYEHLPLETKDGRYITIEFII